MFVEINSEKGKGVIVGYVERYNEGTSKSGNKTLNLHIVDGDQEYWILFLDRVDSRFGDQPRATVAKKFLTSNYFKTADGHISPVGHPVAIKVTKSEHEYNGEQRTSYFGEKLINPKGTLTFRNPDRTILFGSLVGKNANGDMKGSICCRTFNTQANDWADSWFQGKVTDEQLADLQKVNDKCPMGIAWIEGEDFKFKKLSSEAPVPTQAAPATTPAAPVTPAALETPVTPETPAPEATVQSASLEPEVEFEDLSMLEDMLSFD